MKQAYRYAIIHFILFAVLMLLSAVILFGLKIGFSPEAVVHYYTGDAERFIAPKSAEALGEIVWRHLGSMGLLIVVLGHFLLFASRRAKARAATLIMLLFAAALANIFAPYGMDEPFFVWVKLAGTLLLILGIVQLLWILLIEALERPMAD